MYDYRLVSIPTAGRVLEFESQDVDKLGGVVHLTLTDKSFVISGPNTKDDIQRIYEDFVQMMPGIEYFIQIQRRIKLPEWEDVEF